MTGNLLAPPSGPSGGNEVFELLLKASAFRLERIISTGQATPAGEWYEQEQDEWVLLMSGRASLRFEDDAQEMLLKPGDYVLIHAGRRHRVEWTDSQQRTVWLALHFNA